ncbi:TonB family protein [Hyphomonas sp.]|uniref:TonB family protein n=1 Tax=Hyphomonas sp. TaxID=87 RepID=UPI00391B2BAA
MTAHTPALSTAPFSRGPFDTGSRRLALAAMLAAPLVYGLFLAANALIKVREIELAKGEQRALGIITPQMPDKLSGRTKQPPPVAHVVPKPPPMERTAPPQTGGLIFDTGWRGEAPPTPLPGGLQPMIGPVSPVQVRNLTPVRAPAPVMPEAALRRGVSGSCEVRFDVDVSGRPQNVSALCTDEIFRSEAERAVRRSEFLPAIREGRPVAQTGAIYPLEFKVQ